MHLGIRSEQAPSERRVAATPQSVSSLVALGLTITVESGAGLASGFTDDDYREAGADIVDRFKPDNPLDLLATVGPFVEADSAVLADGAVVIGMLDPSENSATLARLAERGVTSLVMEQVPRTTLAQAMDALSSQATAAGYAAVLLGARELPKFLPMLITAAGTVPPARVLILGVGVAGLQAIATAKRLGGVVSAYDIRPETREQVESLGASFVDAPTMTMDEGGYARAIDEEQMAEQRRVLSATVGASDLVITTAQVPGRKAPVLVDADMVAAMAPGSVIIDMAAGSGGNVEGSRPDEVVTIGGVVILGPTDLASSVASDASRMYARNILEVVKRLIVDGEKILDPDDPVIGPITFVPKGAE
jgi:proton-translocating NAD(P)+ transhydrogenase subunit alpha